MQEVTNRSTPSYLDFNPKLIPYQYRVIYDMKCTYDYSIGPQYILLSGSIGSAKSTLMAWCLINHCIENRNATALIGRKALPDLKDTLFQKLIEMLEGVFKEGVDYTINLSATSIKFHKTGSKIISRSWHDKKYTKFRSLELSMIAIEELTENDNKDMAFFNECIGRLGRIPHIKNNIFIAATNPSDPSHKAYEFFIKGAKQKGIYATKDGDKHVYYSRTESNPFLPTWYIKSLREKYDPKMIRRMLEGEWLYISTDVIYYQYSSEKHYGLNLKVNKSLPLRFSFDFNIAKDKPMSSCLFQFNRKASNRLNDKRFNFLDEVAIEGARTLDALEEWQGKGYFDLPHNPTIIVHGDGTGRHNDTRSNTDDFEIIEKYLANYCRKDGDSLDYSIEVPRRNPPIRERHNKVNGQLENANGTIAVAIDSKCVFVDKGLSNTRLKENAGYIEDQTSEGQDMSTAVGYGIWYCLEYEMDDMSRITFS